MNATIAEQNDRYRNGKCCDCGQAPHSAGRPRCNTCHAAHMTFGPLPDGNSNG